MLRPRLSRMGLPLRAASMMREKFCALRAPICRMSACSATSSTSRSESTSVTMPRPYSLRGLRRSEAFLGQALEFVGRGARLVGAAAQEGRALRLHRLGGGHELLLALDRAGAGHEAELLARADFLAVDLDDGVLALLGFAADELVALLHAVDVLDLRPGGERLERLVRVLVADGGDDGLDLAVDGARLVAELRHFGDDFFDFFERQIGLQNNNHGQG